MKNSLVGYNLVRVNPIEFDPDDCNGTITSFGYNLILTTTNCTITGAFAFGDLIGLDPQLSPLANNDGPTQTQALLKGSPAIDAGNPLGCTDFNLTPLITDQRGFFRPINGRCDIGAYEYYPYATFIPTVLK